MNISTNSKRKNETLSASNLPLPSLILSWIDEVIALANPKDFYFCEGGEREWDLLCQRAVDEKILIPLNPEKRPNSFLACSDPSDVARVESRTFIATNDPKEAGPTNNWLDAKGSELLCQELFCGAMEGRTLYIIPFAMGPIGSPVTQYGVMLTDSLYAVVNMQLMARTGKAILSELAKAPWVIPALHSVGVPLKEGERGPAWPCRPLQERYIVHDMERRKIWSFGSGYGGNALLGKKCIALRYASREFAKIGAFAEHMLLSTFTSPEGKKLSVAAAFPSACGKTNFAMMKPALFGWSNLCLGDDIAWMWIENDRMHAINPEAGFFGVAPGTSWSSNPVAMETIKKKAIFTNVALTTDGDVFWEGIGYAAPEGTLSWRGEKVVEGVIAAHPNARYTVSAKQCPILHPAFDDPKGIEIDAILFGGRRHDTVPLVAEARSWEEGVFFGAILSSETTAAAEGQRGVLRHDPMAMLPFFGLPISDYIANQLAANKPSRHMPRHYMVNWFRKDPSGHFVWPGFGENIRVIDWILKRVEGEAKGALAPFGLIPPKDEINFEGLSVNYDALFIDDPKLVEAAFAEGKEYLRSLSVTMP